MNALQKLPGAPPMPGQGLGGIGNAIQRLPGFGGGTGVSSGQQGDAPWQSTGKPMDQEMEARRLLGYDKGPNAADPNSLASAAQQMPAGGGSPQMQGLAGLYQQAAAQGGQATGADMMNKPGMQNMMARMLGSAPAAPMPPAGPMQAQLGAGGGAAAMGEPASYGKSGGAGKAKAAKRGR